MDLEELKQKWNRIDEGMSKSEVYNRRVLIETIKSKTKTTYEQLHHGAMFNLFATLFIAGIVLPLAYGEGMFRDAILYLLEGLCVLGLVMVTCRLVVLSHFNVLEPTVEQLRQLANYKRCYLYEFIFMVVIGIPLFIFSVMLALYYAGPDTAIGVMFTCLGILSGIIGAWLGWKKHKAMMQEIEHHLAELHEFEEEQKS